MSVPHILLLMPFLPTATHAGPVFIRDLLRHYPKEKLCGFSVAPNYTGSPPPAEYEGFPLAWAPQPPEAGITKLGRHVAHLHTLAVHQYLRHVRVPALIKQAVHFGKQHQVDTVWAILHHHTTLTYMAKPVAETLNAELITNIHDPPQQFLDNHKLQGPIRRMIEGMIEKAFADTLRASVRGGVASEGMQAEYKQRYGLDSVVLIHGLHPSRKRPPARGLTHPDKFVIGFAGSLYAQREWEALLSALDNVGWRLEGREVTIKLLGGSFDLRAQGKMHIEYLGWRSLDETLNELSRVDITYLPYWFDDAHRQTVRLCFPNKLSTYVAAGRPVLYHGPENSSPTRFLQRFPVGLCCHSLDKSEIIAILRRFVVDREFYASAAQQTQTAVDEELNLTVFRRRFAAFIGISENQ